MPKRLRYVDEVDQLGDLYKDLLTWDVSRLRRDLLRVAGGPAVFVGTGGTLAVAHLAARLHEQVGGQLARVVTPLELSQLPGKLRAGAVHFSARAKHPDAVHAINLIGDSRFNPSVLVTLRNPSTLADVLPPNVTASQLPSLPFEEGFLATGSVLVMMTGLIRAYIGDDALPPQLPQSVMPELDASCDSLLILTTPDLVPAALDLETRSSELGLVNVQVTDYRNFAHGRHFGLHRRSDRTTVIGLEGGALAKLAAKTMATLPNTVNSIVWKSDHNGPAAVIDLTVASMRLVSMMADAQQVNPARPGATPFGRRLYHMSLRGVLPDRQDGPVERKTQALAANTIDNKPAQEYERAYRRWMQEIATVRFGGLALDYDGTLCSTIHRFDAPGGSLTDKLVHMLKQGITIGVASGRGKSLHSQLRQSIPRDHWSRVLLGLYNGGALLTLADPLPDFSIPSKTMATAAERIASLPLGSTIDIEARSLQVSVSLRSDAFGQPAELACLITDAMKRAPALDVSVTISGHSIDVVPKASGKTRVATAISSDTGLPVLAIGDQGNLGGNDYDLLDAGPWTLTVDRCSANPNGCWYLDRKGRTGPALLAAYLDSIVVEGSSFQFVWPGDET